MRPLTTTSFALLGQLVERDWSAYALRRRWEASMLRGLWPRSGSRLYQEVKNLELHGLAASRKETTGRRERSVYSITDSGRQAFDEWVSSESTSSYATEFEAMLKLLYSFDAGRARQAELVEQIRRLVQDDVEFTVKTAKEMLDQPLFPQRLHLTALTLGWFERVMVATLDWAAWANAEVAGWSPGGAGEIERDWANRQVTEMIERLDAG